ncbi:MAG: hypothetical protein ACLGIR_13750 [Actinomycetes bacterium]
MITCRCEALNNITGEAARDYARQHLDETRSDGQGRTYFRCPETGVSWVEERPKGPYGDAGIRLRRSER